MEVVFTDTQETLLDGKYLILHKLGQGAYGEVFLTKHLGLGVCRAVKRISKSRDIHSTWRREADALKALSHPSLPIIYDIDEDDVYFYIVEEYIEGMPLSEYVTDRGGLTEQETCRIAMSICTVLSYMQKSAGLCHLDVKPENVIVTKKDIRLVDFGSSCMEDVQPEFVTGTIGYAAPELYHLGNPNAACDVYSLGMLMRFMLTGQAPNANQKNHICSENLEFIIKKCTGFDSAERYADAGELYQALEQSQTKNNKGITANPTVVFIAGSGRRVGATHFAIMLAAHFARMGRKCLLELAAEEKKALPIPVYGDVRRISCSGGIYEVNGIRVLPDYHGCAEALTDGERGSYSVIIREIGNIWDMEKKTLDEYGRTEGHFVLVTGHTPEELLDYERAAARLLEVGVDFVSAVNFTDGRGYERIRREHRMGRALRIPYCTQPYSFQRGSGTIEKTIIPGWAGKAEGNRCGRNAKRLWNHAFCSLCRQLSVKRKKKTCGSV